MLFADDNAIVDIYCQPLGCGEKYIWERLAMSNVIAGEGCDRPGN